MNEFVSLPITAIQEIDEPVDPGFTFPDAVFPPDDNDLDPGFSVMPPNQPAAPAQPALPPRPDTPVHPILPPPAAPSRPDIPVHPNLPPPAFPPRPDIPVHPNLPPPVFPNRPAVPTQPVFPPAGPSPVIPCVFCNNNLWIMGGIRLLNAATGYNAFMIYIDNRLVYSGLNFSEVTRYRRMAQGYHTFAVMGMNGFVYVRKSIYVGDGMATIAITNSSNGLDLISIADTTCPMPNANACFRVSNLAFYSGAVNVSLGNVYFNSINFQHTASFSSMSPGTYALGVSRSARPETTLVNTTITLSPRRIYTLYVLNWNPSVNAVRTLLVEDRRN